MSTVNKNIVMILAIAISTCMLTVPLSAAEITWDAEGADTNWSTSANWNPNDSDPSGDDIAFDSTGLAASSTTTNTVNQDYTVSSLKYQYIDSSNWHTTEIPTGVTLTVNGANGVLVGDQLDGKTAKTYAAMTGGGTLSVDNTSADIWIANRADYWQYATHLARLDMSDLASFEATINNLEIGVGVTNESAKYERGTLVLAENNAITAQNIIVSRDSGWQTDAGYLYLGQDNIVNAGTIMVGDAGDDDGRTQQAKGGYGYIYFQDDLSDPTLKVRDQTGEEDSRADMYVGTCNFTSKYSSLKTMGTVDLTGGTVDARLDNLHVGHDGPAGINGVNARVEGTLTFDSGTIDATMVRLAKSGWGGAGTLKGTISVGADATLVAGQIIMSQVSKTIRTEARLNLNGGVVEAGAIKLGNSNANPNRIAVLNFNSGTIRNKADGNLNITDLTTFNLAGVSASHVFDAQDGYTITVDSVMSGDGGFTKTGLGTLDLIEDNTYTGNTTVNAGTLKLSHSSSNNIADSPVITVNAGGTLDVTDLNSSAGLVLAGGQTLTGTGTVTGTTTVAPAAQLAPGSSPGILYTDDLELAGGSISLFDIWGPTAGSGHDQVIGGSEATLTLNENWVLNLDIHPQEPIHRNPHAL